MTHLLNNVQEFHNTPLSDIAEYYRFSVRAINVCSRNDLHDLKAILNYFLENENFLKISNIGIMTDDELCVFCRSILEEDGINVLSKYKKYSLSDEFTPESLNLSLNELTGYYGLSVRAFNVCDGNRLHNLQAILTYFKQNGDFFDFRNIGRKTNDELCFFCKNILQNGSINNLLLNEDEKKNAVLNNLSVEQDKLINQILTREINVLSPRAINVLQRYFDENITFSKLYTSFYDRSRIANLNLIGKKTEEELILFINLMESKAMGVIELNEAEMQAHHFLETLMDAFSLSYSEMNIYEETLMAGNFPIFKFLDALAKGNKLLNERETIVLRARSGYFANECMLSLVELAEQFGVSKERVRQIDYKTDTLLSEVLSPLNTLKNGHSKYLKYPINFSKDIIHVRKSLAKEINDNEGCSFTPKFITKIFGHLHADKYNTIGLELKHFGNTYLIDLNLTAKFDFNAFFNTVQLQIEDTIEDDYSLDFEGYLVPFFQKNDFFDFLLRVRNVCEDIISSEYTEEVEIDWSGNIIFKRNTQIRGFELVKTILEEHGEPMKLQDIHRIFTERYPKYVDKELESLRAQIGKEKDIFIYFGRSSTYGLAKWEMEKENIKGGTIRDIIEEYLGKSDDPQHVLAITEYVASYRPDTNCNSVNSSMLLVKDRFKDMGNWFWGLPSKNYQSFSCVKIPKGFSRHIIDFLMSYPEKNESEMMRQLTNTFGLKQIQVKYYIQYCLEIGKLKRENGQLKYDENSISA